MDTNHSPSTGHDDPRFEPWLGVVSASFIPVALMLVLPHALGPYLIAATVAVFGTGMLMLWKQQRDRAREKRLRDAPTGTRVPTY